MCAAEWLDLVVANAENAAGGSGLTPEIYQELITAGVDGITMGDHVYRRKEIFPLLQTDAASCALEITRLRPRAATWPCFIRDNR